MLKRASFFKLFRKDLGERIKKKELQKSRKSKISDDCQKSKKFLKKETTKLRKIRTKIDENETKIDKTWLENNSL